MERHRIKVWPLPSRSLWFTRGAETVAHGTRIHLAETVTWTWGLDGKGSLEACISPCLQALVTGTGAGCSRRGGGRAAQADSCYFRKPSVTRKAFSQSLGQSFCCLLSRCYPNSLWSSIWGHCNGAWSRVNVCVCVCACVRERECTPTRTAP